MKRNLCTLKCKKLIIIISSVKLPLQQSLPFPLLPSANFLPAFLFGFDWLQDKLHLFVTVLLLSGDADDAPVSGSRIYLSCCRCECLQLSECEAGGRDEDVPSPRPLSVLCISTIHSKRRQPIKDISSFF